MAGRKNTDIFMKAAIEEAQLGLKEGGIPIGSVLVKNGEIVGKGHNKRVQDDDPVAHAEIVCLREAGRMTVRAGPLFYYDNTILYSTLMPCYFCAGAIVQFGIRNVIVGEAQTFNGAREFMEAHGVKVVVLDLGECKKLMKNFIKKHPDIWNEDIGK